MSRSQTEKEHLLALLMQAYSLSELFDILKSVCHILPYSSINTRSKHFRHFRFTLFGLMVKVTGLLERVECNLDLLRNTMPECEESYQELKRIAKETSLAYDFIRENKIEEGKEKIIEAADEYAGVFRHIMRLKENLWLQKD